MRIPVMIFLVGLALQPLACRADDPLQGVPPGVRSTIGVLEEELPRLMEAAEVPGLSIALVADGEVVWTKAFGLRSTGSGAAVDNDTIFEAASLSKPVTAYVALLLAERGRLDLDRPLAEYLPYPRLAHDDRYLLITPRMVLTHSSGLPNWGGSPLEILFDPGTSFRYSGEGYVCLQKTLEKITGKSLQTLAETEVFTPLGMERSSFVWQERFGENVAEGHDGVGRARPMRRSGEANAAASLITTASV